jgi:hypothetical protein
MPYAHKQILKISVPIHLHVHDDIVADSYLAVEVACTGCTVEHMAGVSALIAKETSRKSSVFGHVDSIVDMLDGYTNDIVKCRQAWVSHIWLLGLWPNLVTQLLIDQDGESRIKRSNRICNDLVVQICTNTG